MVSIRSVGLLAGVALFSGCLVPVEVGGNNDGGNNDGGSNSCHGGLCAPTLCTLPTAIDFGVLAKGDSAVRVVELKNTTSSDMTATIDPVTSNSNAHNAFTLDTAPGRRVIPAGATRKVEITFAPTNVEDYLAHITMRASDGCSAQPIKLTGIGVDSVLTWSPVPLDFGDVPPGFQLNRELTFTNLGSAPVQVSGLTASSSDFLVVTPQPIVVPASGSATVQLGFKPTILGPRTARLDFTTNLQRQPSGIAQLKGSGGGPDIDVAPLSDLGSIAYFAGSNPPGFAAQKLTIQNVGTANLRLGSSGTGPVFWFVRVKPGVAGNTASLGELCVGEVTAGACSNGPVSGTYDATQGIAAAGQLEIPIRVTPSSVGLKEWEVVISSNDLDEPEVGAVIRASAVVLPPCDFEAQPLVVNFGTVQSARELDVRISNRGSNASDVCLLSGISLSPTSAPAFTLVGAPIAAVTLQPGTSKTIVVRVAPTGTPPAVAAQLAGTLEFNVSSPTKPRASIPVVAAFGTGCLTIVPNRFDFGTVKKTCNSPTRTFSVYNTCTTALQVSASGLLGTAGEFIAVNTTGIAPNTVINPGAAPLTFELKYQPANDGPDLSAFLLKVSQAGQLVDYAVQLAGNGDSQGLNTDTVLVGTTNKADILMVIDNSGSMADKQLALSQRFTELISYATTHSIDYQIGVTTTDMQVEGGRLVTSGTAPKILTSATPSVASVFAARVQVGVNGSAIEEILAPAVAALTPPLINNENLGLVRAGAKLGILSVSDADDQSPQAVSFYVNQLLALKPAGQVTFSAITPLQATAPSGCSYEGAGPATRTMAAVTAMAGSSGEICSPNWVTTISGVSAALFGGSSGGAFVLSSIPDLTGGKTIVVKVNGVVAPPMTAGGATVWTYDALTNKVLFEPLYAPQPGQTVTATYVATCIP